MREDDLMRAAHRFEVILKAEKGMIKMKEAAACLGVTARHLRRLRKKAKREGARGLLRERRSHPSWNEVTGEERGKIISLRKERYKGFNIAHFRDMLRMRHGIERSHEFYRKLLLEEKLCAPRKVNRRKKRHRKRFEAPRAGVLIQRDTSIHLWVPGAKKHWKLILDLDDHSRKITGAVFSEHDDVLSNMMVSWETISLYGIPFAYYTDNNPIYNPTSKRRKGAYYLYRVRTGEVQETVSQFKRSLRELGIECIHSRPYQPQGKGKVERIFRFMQDRLLNEMADAKVKTIAQANKYLRKWVEWYNSNHVHSTTKQIPDERFAASSIFRPLPGDIDLDQVFCLKYERTVKADNTFQHEGKTYQIEPNKYRISYAKAKVEVRIHLSGKMRVLYKNREIGVYNYNPPKSLTLPSGEDIFALE